MKVLAAAPQEKHPMELVVEVRCEPLTLTMLDEPTYSPGSADNVCSYDREFNFAGQYRPSSRHALICRGPDGTEHSCVLLAGGGASGVHEHSVVVVNGFCVVAVGNMLCSLFLPTLDLNWATKVDWATCFGVYHSPRHDCLLSHGELEIARVSLRGEVVWSAGGADIFSEGFRVVGDHVEAIDFGGQVYRIDIATGRSELVERRTSRCT
jgi:hypothetical protein